MCGNCKAPLAGKKYYFRNRKHVCQNCANQMKKWKRRQNVAYMFSFQIVTSNWHLLNLFRFGCLISKLVLTYLSNDESTQLSKWVRVSGNWSISKQFKLSTLCIFLDNVIIVVLFIVTFLEMLVVVLWVFHPSIPSNPIDSISSLFGKHLPCSRCLHCC